MLFVIALFSLLILVLLHELGHFFAAKKYGVKVEELGIGIPPRIFGIKVGETLYSLNWLPLGAFVRLEGEEDRKGGPRSFNSKSILQRSIIVAAGVIAFWIIAAFIFGILGAVSGIPMQVSDDEIAVTNAKVQIIGIAPNSPAEAAGVELGDFLVEIQGEKFNTVGSIQESISERLGETTSFVLQRQGDEVELSLMPRENPPEGEGAIGVALVRTALVRHSFLEAPYKGVQLSGSLTLTILKGFGSLITSVSKGDGLPAGMQVMGPLGIVDTLKNAFSLGVAYYFYFLGLLSIYLAIFNALPIPAVDGGRLLFLAIEAVRRKPLPERIERGTN
ncbi:MAG TPA: PDZ domain-containing protein, partial [Candidatus Wildermuthbacteria bacterium]|nr:PDZ domain-containing protein [Candidatus Wildermuthbacteria bacterium]